MKVDNMKADEYHAHKGIGSSALKYFMDSPMKFKAALDGELDREDTKELVFGRIAHEYIIEGKENGFINDGSLCHSALALWTAENPGKESKNIRGTTVYKKLKEEKEASGLVVLTPDESVKLEKMRTQFMNHPKAKSAISKDFGQSEVSFFTKFGDIEYKARADFYGKKNDKTYVVDYKTTTGDNFADLQRAIGKFGYDVQAAHYNNVITFATKEPVDFFVFIFQQKEAPYEVAVIKLGKESLDSAHAVCEKIYSKILQCSASGVYPSKYGDNVVEMEVSQWRRQQLEEYV